MLYLIGLGLSSGDIPNRAIEICKKAEAYFDNYTSFVDDAYLSYLQSAIGKKIVPLDRKSMEDDASAIIRMAKTRDIAVMVAGDPLVATTHKILFIEAHKANVSVQVVHASSIVPTLMGESGLDFYRFGPVCSIPKWLENYKPVSFYETIRRNVANNLHSIVLLDYESAKKTSIDLHEALAVLEEAENQYADGIITDDTRMFVMYRLGSDKQQKHLTTMKKAMAMELPGGPAAIIIPAKLSEIEEEVVESMYPSQG